MMMVGHLFLSHLRGNANYSSSSLYAMSAKSLAYVIRLEAVSYQIVLITFCVNGLTPNSR